MRDLLSPELQHEKRVMGATPVLHRVFKHEFYEIFVGLYPGGLITLMLHYKREQLRIMRRLGEAPQDPAAWAPFAVGLLRSSGQAGQGPLQLIRDAKLDCKVMLSLHDRAALKMAGIEVPRSAGRYKDMFGEQG